MAGGPLGGVPAAGSDTAPAVAPSTSARARAVCRSSHAKQSPTIASRAAGFTTLTRCSSYARSASAKGNSDGCGEGGGDGDCEGGAESMERCAAKSFAFASETTAEVVQSLDGNAALEHPLNAFDEFRICNARPLLRV